MTLLQNYNGYGLESHPSATHVIFFTEIEGSTKYTVL